MNETTPIVLDGDEPLVAMLTVPAQGVARSHGVVICAPLGHENICSYRPLRTLAEHLADEGWPVLRFDWPGTGDSAEIAPGRSGIERWTAAAIRAVDTLRAVAGVDEVTLVGLRVGATIGALVATQHEAVTRLVLLGPFVTGRSYLRGLKAFEALSAQWAQARGVAWPPLPEGAVEASGFLLTPDDVAALQSADLTTVDLHGSAIRGALVAVAQPDRGMQALCDKLAGAVEDLTYTESPELAAAWDDTSLSAFPATTCALVSGWLAERDLPVSPRRVGHVPGAAVLVTDGVREETFTFDGRAGRRVAVSCEPAAGARGDAWVLFLNAGGVRRSGPNRLWASYARAWARAGLPSLRIDVAGVGDSDGTGDDRSLGQEVGRFYTTDVSDDVSTALSLAGARGARRVAAVGLCSGAFWSFHAALAREGVAVVGLVNPAVLFWDSSEPSLRTLSYAGRLLRNPRAWHRLVVGARRHARAVVRALLHRARGKGGRAESRNAIIDACRTIQEARIPMHMVFSSGDEGLGYLERRVGPDYVEQLSACGVTLDVIDGPDHTFRPLWSHELLRDSLEAHLRRVGLLPAPQPERVADASLATAAREGGI